MTIEKGREWGSRVGSDEVEGLPSATTDRDVAAHPSGTLLRGGDLGLTLGVTQPRAETASWQRLPIDLLDITYLDRRGNQHHITSAAWVTLGSFFSGPFVVLANTSFVKHRRLFPRSHPNDGRFEVLEVAAGMSLRQRIAALRRVRTDSHLPHPFLTTRNTMTFHATWLAPKRIIVDGRRQGSAREIMVEIRPDAGFTHVAT